MEIEFTLERFENGCAVLKAGDGKEIIWPKNFLPLEVKIGAKLVFSVCDAEQFALQKNLQAKEILNELLNQESGQ